MNRFVLTAKIKLLCGADMLESFAVPDLWSIDDVRCHFLFHFLILITIFHF